MPIRKTSNQYKLKQEASFATTAAVDVAIVQENEKKGILWD